MPYIRITFHYDIDHNYFFYNPNLRLDLTELCVFFAGEHVVIHDHAFGTACADNCYKVKVEMKNALRLRGGVDLYKQGNEAT